MTISSGTRNAFWNNCGDCVFKYPGRKLDRSEITHISTLRPQNTYSRVLSIVQFLQFLSHVWKVGVSSLHSALNFRQKEQNFWYLHILVFCCAGNHYSNINNISNQRFQTEEHALRVNKSKIAGGNTFNVDHFETEYNHESHYVDKTLFWVFLQICDPCYNLKQRNTYNYVFRTLFCFRNF